MTTMLAIAMAVAGRSASAQTAVPGEAAIDREIERMLGDPGADDGETELELDELLHLREHPLDLRSLDPDELAAIPGIDIQAAIAIVRTVRHRQPRDLRDLAGSMPLDRRQLLMLRAFTTLASDGDRGSMRASARLRIESETRARRGGSERLLRVVPATGGGLDTIDIGTPYSGGATSVLARISLARGPFSFDATAAADRGEPFVHRDTVGFRYVRLERAVDTAIVERTRLTAFAGASLAAQGERGTLVVGDFTAELGQGLALADARRRFSVAGGPGAAFVNARRIAPYRSSDEASFLRGIAGEVAVERPLPFRVRLAAFTSLRWRDGTIDTSLDSSGVVRAAVTSLRDDGNRRTVSEIRRSANVAERMQGMGVVADDERWSLGISWITSSMTAEGADGPQSTSSALSCDARVSARAWTLYGELASDGEHVAGVGGWFARFGRTSTVIAVRSIPAGIGLPHGRAFPSSAKPSAERGLYVALQGALGEDLRLDASLDLFERPVPRSTIPFPHSGRTARMQLRWQAADAIAVDAAASHTLGVDGATIADAVGRTHRGLSDLARTRATVTVMLAPEAASIAARVRLDHRVAARPLDRSQESGWLTGGDMRVRLGDALDMRAGIAIFDADGSDVAMASGEADLAGRVRSVRLGGVGARCWGAVRWSPVDGLDVSLSFGETSFIDRRSIGDGLDEIDARETGTIALQIDWRHVPGARERRRRAGSGGGD